MIDGLFIYLKENDEEKSGNKMKYIILIQSPTNIRTSN